MEAHNLSTLFPLKGRLDQDQSGALGLWRHGTLALPFRLFSWQPKGLPVRLSVALGIEYPRPVAAAPDRVTSGLERLLNHRSKSR